MHTQCPHCQTIFRVAAAHLNIAQGHVRCSHCRHIFNATNHLRKQLPEQGTAERPGEQPTNRPTEQPAEPSFRIDNEQPVDEGPTIDFQEADIPELLQEDIYEPPRGRPWKSFFFWGIMVIFLAATLTAQGMWFFQRDKILQHPDIRPWLDRFCYNFLCTLPPTRHLESFEMLDKVVQVHPGIDDALQFEATFINNAAFPQPYPELQLTFEDYNGNPLAQRRFQPVEYLLRPLDKNQQMRPKGSVHVKLVLINMSKIIEGDKVAEGFRLEFF
jgi:predicted Zn finger-like uncharacterized protein